MNDEAVKALWDVIYSLQGRVSSLEARLEFLKGQIKARLREEAEGRQDLMDPSYSGRQKRSG